jgi:energy-coupling factor transporter ATP-binding protein EcfA2
LITELSLSDFKAFSSACLELRPITVLVGENNSGKSSVLAAIRLLAQTAQGQDPTVPLLFDGPFGDFGSFKDVVHGNHRGRPMAIEIKVPFAPRFRPRKAEPGVVSLTSEFKYRTQRRETFLRTSKLRLDGQLLLEGVRAAEGSRLSLVSVGGTTIPVNIRGQFSNVMRMNGFIPSVNTFALESRSRRAETTITVGERLQELSRNIRGSSESLSTALRNVEVIGAMREPPARTYIHSGAVSRRVGVAGENWGSLVALASSERSKRSSFMKHVTRWMNKAGIAAAVDIHWLSDRHFEIVIENPLSGERENISDVGRGTSQVLPVVVGGYRLDRGDTYLVEEPEIHLHPRAQAALGDFFLDLAKRGVQTILETHSEYLVMRLQQHVASGDLDPKDVIFYYVESTTQGKSITPLEMDQNATFVESIPGGFFPQRMSEATGLARARGKRNAQ